MDTKKILIVDDDQNICVLLSILLTKKGYETATSNSGGDALLWLEQNKPDLVILDIMMPEMDGWEIYDHMRSRYDLPVIFLTAVAQGENAARALKMGAADYIRKPYHSEELLARIEALLHKAKQPEKLSSITSGLSINERPSVSVILPTLNEAQNLPLVLPYFPPYWVDEIILVDGLSTDNTVEIAKRLLPSIKVVIETKRGKGAALQAGYRVASGDIVIVLDCDGSNDPREIPRFVSALMQGADLVKGSRFAPGGGTTDMPRYRQLGNGFFVFLCNTLFGTKFTDLCYGYHAFWKYCVDSIHFPSANGFEIDTALYLGAVRDQLRITEVPSFEGYRFYGTGKLQTFPDGWRVLKAIFQQWMDHMKTRNQSHPYLGFHGNRLNKSVADLTSASAIPASGEPVDVLVAQPNIQNHVKQAV